MAGEGTGGNGKAIMLFTLNGNGGPPPASTPASTRAPPTAA